MECKLTLNLRVELNQTEQFCADRYFVLVQSSTSLHIFNVCIQTILFRNNVNKFWLHNLLATTKKHAAIIGSCFLNETQSCGDLYCFAETHLWAENNVFTHITFYVDLITLKKLLNVWYIYHSFIVVSRKLQLYSICYVFTFNQYVK